MALKLSPQLVKNSLSAHSWLGIAIGLLMYWVCLSGSLAVFYPEFERWETPTAAEFTDIDPTAIDEAYRTFMAKEPETSHAYVLLPRPGMPRTQLANDHGGRLLEPDGRLGPEADHPWTHLLTDLHLFLHLPKSWGMIVVSALGALLVALILSGIFAHPRLFKDAFHFRRGRNARLEQTDLHNRLSVWGLPFHLMIAITGAFFGLASLLSWVAAEAFYDGDTDAVIETVYGAHPEVQTSEGPAAVGRALSDAMERAPEGTHPIYVTVEHPGTDEEHVLVGTHYPDRLIYAEQFVYDDAGQFMHKVGFSDGEPGRQAIFSVYRLHFGHFGGPAVKFLYLALGLALTVVSVTGINIWLAKRKHRDYLNNLWVGLVWGTPLAFATSAVGQVLLGWPGKPVFWGVMVAAAAFAQWRDREALSKRWLQASSAAALLVLVAGYHLRFGGAALAGVAPWLNLGLILAAAWLLWAARKRTA